MTVNPCDIVKFDSHSCTVNAPTILLKRRNLSVIGEINTFDDWNISLQGNGIHEISFDVHKYANGMKCNVWDDIIDLKIIEVIGVGNFEISVSVADNEETIKNVSAQSLEVELGQLTLHEFHVNDEQALSMELTEYNASDFNSNQAFIPTVFCNKDDPAHSLLHRILADKAPHWSIGSVPTYIAINKTDKPMLTNKFQRSYTLNNKSIYDFLTNDIAKESNVIFQFDTYNRKINCYNAEAYTWVGTEHDNEDNEREITINVDGIGEDTAIFIDKQNLANEISISSNKDEVKNCFRISGGDDVISDYIRAVNMNGSNYIYKFSPFQLEDMSDGLSAALLQYQNELTGQKDTYYGKDGIFLRLCELYEILSNLVSAMMPKPELAETDAQAQYDKLVCALDDMEYGVASLFNPSNDSFVGVTNRILEISQILVDFRYEVKVIEDSTSYDSDEKIWKGKLKVFRTKDENEFYISPHFIEISITTDETEYQKQKIMKALAKTSMFDMDFEMLGMTDEEIEDYFELYSLNRLTSFKDAYESCVIDLGKFLSSDNSNEQAQELYEFYTKHRLAIVSKVHKHRQEQVNEVNESLHQVLKEQMEFQEKWNFKHYLDTLDANYYNEFCMYRREDSYENSNYISDGLGDYECLIKVKELLDVANAEIEKACILQRKLSINLNNLLLMSEFQSFREKFALFNYIRCEADDEIFKLRLLALDYDSNAPEKINVTFAENIESVDGNISDLESILNQVATISSSYSSTVLQAKQGSDAGKTLSDLFVEGLDASKIILKNNDNNEVVINSSGILCRQLSDDGIYNDNQLRIVGNGIYMTDDAWANLKTAFGEIVYEKYGIKEKRYGLIADNLIGKFIASEVLHIGNENGTVIIDGDGIEISGGLIQSENYKKSNGAEGSMIDLKEGEFSFAGGNLSFDDLNGLKIKGNVAVGSIVEGSSMIGGNINIGYGNFVVDAKGNITSKGNISLANGNISYNSNELSICGNVRLKDGLYMYGEPSEGIFDYIKILFFDRYAESLILYCATQISFTENVTVEGALYVHGGGNVLTSDKNLKHNILSLNPADSSEFIYSLNPVEFKYDNGTSNRLHHGFIAQDVKKSMKDNDWGVYVEQENGDKGLRYEELIADLVATVQSQNERISKLETKLNAMQKAAE